MPDLRYYRLYITTFIVLFLLEFYFFANTPHFMVAYIAVFIFLAIRTLSIPTKKRLTIPMFLSYSVLLFLQLSFVRLLDGSSSALLRFFCAAGIFFPFAVERFFIVNKHVSFYFPSMQELSTFGFNELHNNYDRILNLIEGVRKTGKALSVDNIGVIAADFPRTSSFRYVNNGTLTSDYFEAAEGALDDPYMYIVISNTGSPASEVLSIFTRKQYNHASLSFDADLKTIISYNGGERVYPPGLNREMVEYFHKKSDSSIIVYKLSAMRGQKEKILEQIHTINEQGSAYNILGLVLKSAYKSNILFCSQFVYKMLKCADLQYFKKNDDDVRPMDFVELDIYRKLQFAYEIDFAGESKG